MEWRENQVQIKLTLLVVIGILGIITICIFTNKAFQSLRATVNEFHYPDQKIRTLNSLLDQTNNSDQYLRLYAITKKSAYLKKYDESLDSINKLFASYRKYTKADSFKNNQIDTIQMWWNNKVKDNKTLLKLNSDKPDILVIGKLLDYSKDTTIFSTQINNEKTIRDSLVIVKKIPFNQEQKTGMLHKVKKLFEKKR
ncbi:MAG: CHASE3 domain-containing protein [Cytophaga sp.]|uniref:CHASE3 domain-containing protein n=1 Tax=Cytophaga sp. TaxID=29535 RepID=UPI003F810E10